ncbi:MAG: HAMP domain-containing histidine kinase [Candidatus Omnitrophica bacterium]|nr:HAMP domain-containing histidine kinase [Candidatus Omnitrophota bacterium]
MVNYSLISPKEFNVQQQKRIDIYIAAVIIPSIILAVVALLALWRQYNFINFQLISGGPLAAEVGSLFGSFSRVSVFAFAMIILALILILIIGSYLSTHDVQRQLEVARLKNDFVSTVSHELKTPLTSIRLLAERLLKLKPEENAKQKEYHNLILTQSYYLSHLIGNILDFSKLEEEGKAVHKLEQVELGQLIRQAIADYPVELTRPDCKLELNIASSIPALSLDKAAITRAFINLLDNALKFSPPGGIIKINAGKDSAGVFIQVADQGPGIEQKEQDKIFERFYHTGKGTGLGLTLVRHIVEAHQGRVELESEKGKGSKFRIILPLKGKL